MSVSNGSFPAFQLYPRDWIVSTRTLTLEERGVYFDLLCFAWDQDGVPNDIAKLAALVGLSATRFKRVWPAVSEKWVDAEDGRLRNPRQELQRRELREYAEKASKAGKKGAKARWHS